MLSFPPHIVRQYFERFELSRDQVVLDPFCGTGTTLVVAKARGFNCIGVEANPVAHFASTVKLDWEIDPELLLSHARDIASDAQRRLNEDSKLKTLPSDAMNLLLTDSISPLPLHKSLILLEAINNTEGNEFRNHELLAFIKIVVQTASNLHFGPEVGVRLVKKTDAPVISDWLREVEKMAEDMYFSASNNNSNKVYLGDARVIDEILPANSIDAVFTSPPYPNEKDYTRTTRLESVLLGFLHNKDDLRILKKGLLRSNTRNVFKGDNDDSWVAENPEIQRISEAIEKRRIDLGKTSGFEKQYSKVAKLYFGGMARHFAGLRTVLKSGANLAYVVGDQASYLQVMIRTGELLAEIAQGLGYEVVNIDLFRTRFASATKQQIREEVVVLKWNRGMKSI